MAELTEDMLRLHRALEVEPSAYWSEVADKAEAVQHEKQAYFNHWRNVIEKLQRAEADLAELRKHYNAALDRVQSERTRLEESQTLAEERLVSIGHWKAANEEAQRERDELRNELAEISFIAGPGGDDTPFGRVESAFTTFHGKLDDAQARLNILSESHERLRQCVRDRETEALAAMAEADELRAERDALRAGMSQMRLLAGLPLPPEVVAELKAKAQRIESLERALDEWQTRAKKLQGKLEEARALGRP